VRKAAGLGKTTGTDHARAQGDDAEGDEKQPRVVAIAVGSSATTVVVDGSAARGSAPAFGPSFDPFDRWTERSC
jgi:hypothetical protein